MSTREPDVTFSIGAAIRSDDIRVPALTTRSFVAWLLGTAAAVVVASVVVLTTQPEHRLGVLVGAPLVAAGIAGTGWRSAWIEPGSNALVTVRWRSYRRRVPLGPGTEVVLLSNRAGVVLLGARSPGARRRLYVPVLRLDPYVERSLDPAVLRLLADAVERGLPTGWRTVTRQLRAQAAHGAAGGEARTSPLGVLLGRPGQPPTSWA